jgi:hypothetical protein
MGFEGVLLKDEDQLLLGALGFKPAGAPDDPPLLILRSSDGPRAPDDSMPLTTIELRN